MSLISSCLLNAFIIPWNQKITHDPPYSLTVIHEKSWLLRPVGLEGIVSLDVFFFLFFSRAKNGGEGEGPRVSLWRPRRVGESRPRYPEVVVLLRVRPTFGVVFAAKRSRRRRPRYFFSLSGARDEELRESWFSIKAVGKIPITETPPWSTQAWPLVTELGGMRFPGTFTINQTRKTAQLLCPMAIERWGGLGRLSANFPHFPALSRGNPW